MIGKLIGFVEEINDGLLLLNVGGVCYKVSISYRDAQYLLTLGNDQKISIITEHVIREDAQLLYGFLDKNDHIWFIELTKISGVGPRFAMSILSSLDQDQIYHAIISEDENAISKANGIGAKLASRVVNEIKPRIGKIVFHGEFKISNNHDNVKVGNNKSIINDATNALIGMGFQKNIINQHVKDITKEKGDISTEDLIKNVLQRL